MNTQRSHRDAAWSERQSLGQQLLNLILTLSTVAGLSVARLTKGTTVTNPGSSELRFPRPMFHGNKLHAKTVLQGNGASKSRPRKGIVTLEHIGRDQRGKTVCRAVRSTLGEEMS
jgi:acyl dehydratase